MSLNFILIILAAICFFLAALQVPKTPVHLGWVGIFILTLTLIIK